MVIKTEAGKVSGGWTPAVSYCNARWV